jgi:N-acetylmuramoyl-L-alanine amidase
MKRVALVVGHKSSSPGAYNIDYDLSEFEFNRDLVYDVGNKLVKGWFDKVEPIIIFRESYNGLPRKINDKNPDFIISFHCNAYNTRVSGTEVLYYHRSKTGKWIARVLQDYLLSALDLNDRGILSRTAEDRGGYLLRYTNAPCVIAEPFFIDNNNDLKYVLDNRNRLVDAYVDAIEEIAGDL